MDQIEPVGGVGDVAARRAEAVEVAQSEADQRHGPGPGRQRVERRQRQPRQAGRRDDRGDNADDRQLGDGEAQAQRQVRRPGPPPGGEDRGLAVQQPAEAEGAEVGDRRGEIGEERRVRGRHAEPGQPVRRRQERQGGRCGEHEEACGVCGDEGDRPVDCAPRLPGQVQPGHHHADRQGRGIEPDEEVKEPQVGQREGREAGVLRRRRQGVAVRHRHRAPDGHDDEGRKQDRPADQQRRGDPLGAVSDEALRAAAVESQVREKAGDQEKGGHAEDVQHMERQPERDAGVVVHHDPQWHALRSRQERSRRVKHDAGDQGEAPHRVERMQAFA